MDYKIINPPEICKGLNINSGEKSLYQAVDYKVVMGMPIKSMIVLLKLVLLLLFIA